MCGIVGYVGKKDAVSILVEGLETLEYRGYDSAGVALLSGDQIKQYKSVGKVEELKKVLRARNDKRDAHTGIAHTRWATHGIPNEVNAHPHRDCTGRVSLVHNGIIENHRELQVYLEKRGHAFVSATDTEVVAHLIEDFLRTDPLFKSALASALCMLKGAYALAILDRESPGVLYAARRSSPLVIGIGSDEHYIASDPAALVGKTREIVYMQDGDVAEISSGRMNVVNLEREPAPIEVITLEWDIEQAQRGSYPHFMLKEIHEGPEVVCAAMRGRVYRDDKGARRVKLGGLDGVSEKIARTKRLIILGCGTSYYAGMIGERLIEEVAGMPVDVQIASEFRYSEEPLEKDTAVLALSQSGETADTLAALQKAKRHGLLTLGIVNIVGSAIARETDAGVYNHAGPEIGVASTKAFLSQVTVLALVAAYIAERRGTSAETLLCELEHIPEKIEAILAQSKDIEKIALGSKEWSSMFFLGRSYGYPTALEGALKLKEVSYIHAEGYGAGEMKHGPIALIDADFPTFAIVTTEHTHEKMLSNLQEIKARGGPVYALAYEDDEEIEDVADEVMRIPRTLDMLSPLVSAVPLQLFAYYAGVARGYDVDKPRNLAKAVTVE